MIKRFRDPLDATVESGMPVYVRIPEYTDGIERKRVQDRLRADFEFAKRQPPPSRPLYPIRFSFRSSSLSPLDGGCRGRDPLRASASRFEACRVP